MGDTILIETTADEVVSIVTQGPQGPSGAEAATLTTQGDTLYRGLITNQRLPIGSPGQVLKVNSGATAPEWANESGAVTEVNGQTGAVTLTASDVGAAPSTGIDPTAITGTAVVDSDARLSDSRSPTTHAASHAAAGSDPLELANLAATGTGEGDLLVADGGGAVAWVAGQTWAAQNITSQDIGAASSDHTHGNITNDGKVGSISGLPLKTGTAGVVEAGAFGTGAGEFAEGNHTHADLHTRSHAITSTSDHTAGAHKVFYSDGSGNITELALGSSGEVLTSNGASAAPSFAAASGGSSGSTNLWIPASAWIPKTTAGCGVDSRELATNDQNFDELLFDAGTDEFADALVVMPSNYNNGTITARFYWTAASGSGGVAFAIQGRALANDDALDTAAGTAQLVTDTLIAANDMHVTSATSAVTIGGTPAANTPIQFTIYRDVSDAADDLAVDARLLGVEIIYTAA